MPYFKNLRIARCLDGATSSGVGATSTGTGVGGSWTMAYRGKSATPPPQVPHDGSYLEEYVETISAMPNEIRRHFELMRALDKEAGTLKREVDEMEKKIVSDTKRRKRDNSGSSQEVEAARETLASKRQRAHQMAGEKVQISEQAYNLAENYINKLDLELGKFEEHLRTSGEFSASGASPGDQVAAKPDEEWILARVQEYDINSGFYTVRARGLGAGRDSRMPRAARMPFAMTTYLTPCPSSSTRMIRIKPIQSRRASSSCSRARGSLAAKRFTPSTPTRPRSTPRWSLLRHDEAPARRTGRFTAQFSSTTTPMRQATTQTGKSPCST